jgi:hypothetical protein
VIDGVVSPGKMVPGVDIGVSVDTVVPPFDVPPAEQPKVSSTLVVAQVHLII